MRIRYNTNGLQLQGADGQLRGVTYAGMGMHDEKRLWQIESLPSLLAESLGGAQEWDRKGTRGV